MPKFATKAADNMFCQARYEAAKFNERLSSREGAAEELGVDRTRLARIELGSVTPYPEEVLLMADIYRAPELKGNYCREMCPLGKGMPKIENQDIDRIALRALCSFRKINEAKELLLDITADTSMISVLLTDSSNKFRTYSGGVRTPASHDSSVLIGMLYLLENSALETPM